MNEKIALTAEKYNGSSRVTLAMKCTEWCAEFVTHVLKENGLSEYTSTSCNTMFKKMKDSTCWILPDSAPQRGDVIFFDWNSALDSECNTRPLDHVGIVTACDGKTLTYIDGNSDTSGIVKQHTIVIEWSKFNGNYPWYYMRYVNPVPPVKKEPKTDIMELLDIIEEKIKLIKLTIDKLK